MVVAKQSVGETPKFLAGHPSGSHESARLSDNDSTRGNEALAGPGAVSLA